MFGLFKKKVIEIKAPITGKVIPIEEVPDPVFSDKMVGDGIGIEPTEGEVVSPVDGEIVQVFPTKHAIGIKTAQGIEILLHIGLDTVKLNGEGFESFVNSGDQVKTGQKLLTFDLTIIKEKAKSIISPIVITNAGDMESIEKSLGSVVRGENTVLTVQKK